MSFIVRRSLAACAVIFSSLTIVFLILFWLPGDTAALIAGEDATPETIAHLRAVLGSDKPLWQQYASYLGGLVHGNMGTSTSTGEPVSFRLAAQIPATLELTLVSCALAIVLGVLLGVVAGVNRERPLDHLIQLGVLFLTSVPQFWLGILLIIIFSVRLRWLPPSGDGSFQQLILPVVCLGLGVSARLARMVRNSIITTLDEPFILSLRARGLREHQIVLYHLLRNSLIPVITLLGLIVGELLSGALIIETLFARRGLGRLLVEAVNLKDVPMVMGVVLFMSTIYILVNLLIDLSYAWIDPRVQL